MQPMPRSTRSAAQHENEAQLNKEFDTMLEAIKKNGTPCDIVLKDISTVHRDVNNLVQWEKLVMDKIRRFEY